MRALALALLAACGGSSVGSDANGGGGPDGPPPAHTGGVGLTVVKAMGTTPPASTSAYAQFNSAAPQCTTSHRMGTCYVQQCTTGAVAASAGTITITGGSQMITLTPGTTGQYSSFGATTDLARPGDQLTVTAAGDMAPAFTSTLTMPAPLTITSPAKPATTVAVNRANDFTLTWTGGTSGLVDFGASSAANGGEIVLCEFEASAGTGTVPAALLSLLPAGQGGMSLVGWATTTKETLGWGLYFSLFYDSLWPDGTLAGIGVTFN